MNILLFIVFFCLWLIPHHSSSASNETLGWTLSAAEESSPLISPSQEFAFGFNKLNGSDLFLLGIWYNKIPQRTIVWYAYGDNPNPEFPRGSTLQLTENGLVLNNPQGLRLWTADPSHNTTTVSEAAMLDTGNFVLAGSDSGILWESFKHPTDYMLPNQTLDLGQMLFSKLTATNFSKGRFELHFADGNVKLNPIAWPSSWRYKEYYSSGTSGINSSNSGNKFVFDGLGDIYVEKNNGDDSGLAWDGLSPSVNQYYRATLDFDGVFTQYSYPKDASNGIWSVVRYLPENICTAISTASNEGGGVCGFNGYCSIQNGRPSCFCPIGYEYVDQDNHFMGCKGAFPQGCSGDDGPKDPGELYEIKIMDNVNWPGGDYERLDYNQKDCEQSCIYDSSCAVAIYNGDAACFKKRWPLSNGQQIETGSARALLKVRKDNRSSSCNHKSGRTEKAIVVAGAVLLGGSVLFLLVAISLIAFVRHNKEGPDFVRHSNMSDTNICGFTYKELEIATNGFKEELGRGSFGIVYKGSLKSGSGNAIAVKKLDKLAQEREREFKTELSAIGKTHHKNLVQLLGFCEEGVHRILVYEFMSNGALANLLFTIPKPDWYLRVRVTLEIAKGLVYLHEECNVPIIHCDIKPQNILLDQHFTAKISDFGLSKLLLSNQSRTRTMIRGTRGYMAPEWFKNVPITAKVDVFSFGVMLLEIICCRRSVEMDTEEERRAILTDWVYDCYVEGRLDILVDNDHIAMTDKGRLHEWLMIAIWCIQEEPAERPSMKMIMQMLEGFAEVPKPPFPSSFN